MTTEILCDAIKLKDGRVFRVGEDAVTLISITKVDGEGRTLGVYCKNHLKLVADAKWVAKIKRKELVNERTQETDRSDV